MMKMDSAKNIRLFFLRVFVFFYQLISRILNKSRDTPSLPPIDKTSLAYLETEYVDTRKKQFLKTYEKEGSRAYFSTNIERVFYDPKALNELLTDETNSLEKAWKTRILIEHTPRGNVFMFYDPYKQAFSYYSDQTVIPYQVMNAVAMKYVITYLCRDFFMDDSVVPKEDVSPLFVREEPKRVAPKTEKSPFVKPKTYPSVSTKTDIAIEKVTNRFVHLGKVRNYELLSKSQVKQNANNGFQTSLLASNKLSYEEYKKLRQEKTNL